MSIILAIHEQPGGFSDRWIEYCSEHQIEFEIISCFESDVMGRLKNMDALLWHWVYYDPRCPLVARQIISSVEKMGLKVFPNTATCWHYDDKIGQKYLLEAIDAPRVETYVFYDREDSLKWIEKASLPKVFKLRNGSGSKMVRLIRTEQEAIKYCKQAFSSGFSATPGYFSDTRTKLRNTKNMMHLITKLKRMPQAISEILEKKDLVPKQRGYIYFQDFLSGNDFDTRITIIGNRAFGFKRANRPNDFRASGSGEIIYDPGEINGRCIEIAFEVSAKINAQSLAFDFVFDQNQSPKIVELSYCFQNKAVYNCPGHWDKNMQWHAGHFWPEDAILIDLLKSVSNGD